MDELTVLRQARIISHGQSMGIYRCWATEVETAARSVASRAPRR
uniref:Uncharacterized protein n=1 Tax=Arundo donax TaxID=35708 RepID=A0A0A8ZUS4_ARUDO